MSKKSFKAILAQRTQENEPHIMTILSYLGLLLVVAMGLAMAFIWPAIIYLGFCLTFQIIRLYHRVYRRGGWGRHVLELSYFLFCGYGLYHEVLLPLLLYMVYEVVVLFGYLVMGRFKIGKKEIE